MTDEVSLTVYISPETEAWLKNRAKENSRRKCREAQVILEAERKRDARQSNQLGKTARC